MYLAYETRHETQRREHPGGGNNLYVVTFVIFNHKIVLIEMLVVTLPPILMFIHFNDLILS